MAKKTCYVKRTKTLPSTYQHPTKSYRGRSWLGDGRELIGGYQVVGVRRVFRVSEAVLRVFLTIFMLKSTFGRRNVKIIVPM